MTDEAKTEVERSPVERYDWWKALRTSDLSPTARHVALALATYMNAEGGDCWPSMPTIAGDVGRARSTVAAAIKELDDAGYLERVSGGGRRGDGGYVSNSYQATVPDTSTENGPGGRTDKPRCGPADRTDAMGSGPADRTASEAEPSDSEGGAVRFSAGNRPAHRTRSTHDHAIQEPTNDDRATDLIAELHSTLGVALNRHDLTQAVRPRLDDGWAPDDLLVHLVTTYEREDARRGIANPTGLLLTLLDRCPDPAPPKTNGHRQNTAARQWGTSMAISLDPSAFVEAVGRQYPEHADLRAAAQEAYDGAYLEHHKVSPFHETGRF